jgi:uncharacterized protein (TIGR00251 family)
VRSSKLSRDDPPRGAGCAHRTNEGTVLLIHVQPKASCTEFAGYHGDLVKIRLAAPPTDGAANAELCRFLAARFSLPLAKVQLLSGRQSRRKRVLLKAVPMEMIDAFLP